MPQRKHRLHFLRSYNLKDASHESFVFMNHGCDLNGKICMKVANGALAADCLDFGIDDVPF